MTIPEAALSFGGQCVGGYLAVITIIRPELKRLFSHTWERLSKVERATGIPSPEVPPLEASPLWRGP